MKKYIVVIAVFGLTACNNEKEKTSGDTKDESKIMKRSFKYDIDFLKQYHKDLIVLGDSSGAQIAVAPAYQGRVMTSTAEGKNGSSFGWVNYDLIASGKPGEHINAVGGEERFWLGPEGGQFSIYFKKGVEFKFDNWFVPKEIDSEPFQLTAATKDEAKFEKEIHLENYSGNKFDLLVNRNIRLLDKAAIDSALGISPGDAVQGVAFESDNSITNKGSTAWNKNSGMLSIWILSMLNASDQTTVAVPYKQGDTSKLGKIVTDDYFGKVPADRLKIESGLFCLKQMPIIEVRSVCLHHGHCRWWRVMMPSIMY